MKTCFEKFKNKSEVKLYYFFIKFKPFFARSELTIICILYSSITHYNKNLKLSFTPKLFSYTIPLSLRYGSSVTANFKNQRHFDHFVMI